MGTDKPLISILMAVYEPRMDWLRQQLVSLNDQTYPNLRLYIRDDCSPTVPYEQIQSCVRDCITRFPYVITRNEENLGSNGTFELLTEEADGDLFAYCDQDDVWLPEKLAVLQEAMERERAMLVCSDMYIIDGDGKQVADSITKVRRHHVFRSGTDLARGLLTSNFVTGCTMLVQSDAAKRAIPFCPYMVHDHYIALCCAAEGMVYSSPERTIRYRIHGGNQTGLVVGVADKASYGKERIEPMLARMQWLKDNFVCGAELEASIRDALLWAQARDRNWHHRGGSGTVWKYRRFSPLSSMGEIFLKYAPDGLFAKVMQWARRNRI